jgi:hypothetical protein
VILAFVSSQLAWNLRPFVGSRDLPFELVRTKESNFYVAVMQSAANLFKIAGDQVPALKEKLPEQKSDTSKTNYVERR